MQMVQSLHGKVITLHIVSQLFYRYDTQVLALLQIELRNWASELDRYSRCRYTPTISFVSAIRVLRIDSGAESGHSGKGNIAI